MVPTCQRRADDQEQNDRENQRHVRVSTQEVIATSSEPSDSQPDRAVWIYHCSRQQPDWVKDSRS